MKMNDRIARYVIDSPMEGLPNGEREYRKEYPSGTVVTAVQWPDGSQAWTYDFTATRY